MELRRSTHTGRRLRAISADDYFRVHERARELADARRAQQRLETVALLHHVHDHLDIEHLELEEAAGLPPQPMGTCRGCNTERALRHDGTVRAHRIAGQGCPGTGLEPRR